MKRRWLLALALALALPAAAEVRRFEAVGAAPVRLEDAGTTAPRQAALQRALSEAVTRVALEFLAEADPEAAADVSPSDALGSDPGRYAASFRILEDRGERPALFVEGDVATEYVVVVEVHVDLDRVRGSLVEAGLLAPEQQPGSTQRVQVEVDGLDRYPAYEAMLRLLREQRGARSVTPGEFEPGRTRIEVLSDLRAPGLLDRILQHAPPELDIVPVQAGADRVRISVIWRAPPPSATGEAGRADRDVPQGRAAASRRGARGD